MTDDKEESMRKEIRANLDAKGWEALLEGVPRIDEQEKETPAPEKAEAQPPETGKHVLKVRHRSGEVSERVTSEDTFPESEPVPASPADEPGESQTGPASSAPAVNQAPTAPPPAPPSAPEKKAKETWLTRMLDSALRQPYILRMLHLYRGLNPREQRIILLGVAFFLGLILYALVLDPMLQATAVYDRRIEQKQQELSEMNRLRSSIVQDQGSMDQIKKVIEQRGGGFSIFARLEQLATKADMKARITSIKPQRQSPVGPFLESLAEIKLENISLEELTRFLYEIESSEDLLYVKNVKIRIATAGPNQEALEANLSVGTLLQGRP